MVHPVRFECKQVFSEGSLKRASAGDSKFGHKNGAASEDRAAAWRRSAAKDVQRKSEQ